MPKNISIEFSKRKSLRSNTIGMRATYGLTLLKIKEDLNDLCVFTADTSTSAGLERFRNNFPESFFDCGISEQCMIASAAGYVAEGGIALASTFAPFLILRAAEQIRLSMGYMKLPLVITGLASGIALGYLGYTHCCVEDLPYILNIPNIYVYSPSDAYELEQLLPEIIKLKKPTYIRLTGTSKIKPVYNQNFQTDLSSPIQISNNGDELLVLSTGSISSNAKEAVKISNEKNPNKISHYVVPFFSESTNKSLENLMVYYKKILVLDEAMFGGLASFCLKILNNVNADKKLFYNCHPEFYLNCGSYEYMLKQCKLDIDGIANSIETLINN